MRWKCVYFKSSRSQILGCGTSHLKLQEEHCRIQDVLAYYINLVNFEYKKVYAVYICGWLAALIN